MSPFFVKCVLVAVAPIFVMIIPAVIFGPWVSLLTLHLHSHAL
jgi:hypothetical protein